MFPERRKDPSDKWPVLINGILLLGLLLFFIVWFIVSGVISFGRRGSLVLVRYTENPQLFWFWIGIISVVGLIAVVTYCAIRLPNDSDDV